MSLAFMPRSPLLSPLQGMRTLLGDDFYMFRFQEPGVAEEEFARIGMSDLMKSVLTIRDPKPPCVPKEIGFGAFWEIPATLPSWLTEEDIAYYADKHSKKGLTGGLNYYRNIDRNWELTAPWTGAKIKVPVKFIIGDLDLTYHFPGVKDYLHKGGFKNDVPFLEEVVVIEGASHFINEEKPDEINSHIYDFIKKFDN